MENAVEAFNPGRNIELNERGQVARTDSLALLSMTHRLFALLTAGYLAWLVRRVKPQPMLAATALALAVFSIGQIAIGVSAVWFQLPLWLLTLHNFLAAGLLLSSINLLHRLVPPAVSALPE